MALKKLFIAVLFSLPVLGGAFVTYREFFQVKKEIVFAEKNSRSGFSQKEGKICGASVKPSDLKISAAQSNLAIAKHEEKMEIARPSPREIPVCQSNLAIVKHEEKMEMVKPSPREISAFNNNPVMINHKGTVEIAKSSQLEIPACQNNLEERYPLSNNYSCSFCYFCPNYMDLAISHIERGGIGYEVGYTTASAFYVPVMTSQYSYPFLDGRVHLFDNGKFASNIGIGMRFCDPSTSRIVGFNFFYDCRNTHDGNFNQIGAGFEFLGPCLDFRFNGYLPVGETCKLSHTCHYTFTRGLYAIENQYLDSLKGLDAEIGTYICKGNTVQWYGATGIYMLNCDFGKYFAGGRARLSCFFGDNPILDLIYTHDDLFGSNFQVEVTFPFVFPCCMKKWECLFPRLWRNEIIPLVDVCCVKANF